MPRLSHISPLHWTSRLKRAGLTIPMEDQRQALNFAQQAVAADPDHPFVHWSISRVLSHQNKYAPAMDHLLDALKLDPGYADALAYMAYLQIFTGKPKVASGYLESARSIARPVPSWYEHADALIRFSLRDWQGAISRAEAALLSNPDLPWPRRLMVAAYGHLGQRDEAEWQIVELSARNQPDTVEAISSAFPFRGTHLEEIYIDGLRKAGVPE